MGQKLRLPEQCVTSLNRTIQTEQCSPKGEVPGYESHTRLFCVQSEFMNESVDNIVREAVIVVNDVFEKSKNLKKV